ncbi:MAG: biotin--[acetyl-CoA-carboxylase] ligase [Parvibaculaceae bacterium]
MAAPLTAFRLIGHDSIDSTNAEAHRLAAAGERGPLWIWARRQTEGRGRRGRAWTSEPGNLFATMLLTVSVPARIAAELGFVATLAVRDCFARFLPEPAGLTLKWPNDVLLDGAKIAGILTETCDGSTSSATVAAVGCGLNLAHAPSDTRYPATALSRHGAVVEADDAMRTLAGAMERWLAVWNDGDGFPAIRRAWIGSAHRLGYEISVTVDGEPVVGIFEGLAEDGALMLGGPSGKQRRFHAGEVSVSFEARGAGVP